MSLTTDVQALGQHCASKPGAPSEPNWLSQNQPLAIHGTDLREATRCIKSFRLTRGEVGQIIRGAGGNPDDVVACFTNCGRYEYPGTPAADCNPDTDPACKYWRDFCCYGPPGDLDHIYGGKCTSDSECGQSGGCWDMGVIFAPGGTTVPITDSGPVPRCSSLPNAYGYDALKQICSGDIDAGALFAGAAESPECTTNDECPIIPSSNPSARYGCNTQLGRCATWACKIADGGPVATGTLLCQW